MTLDGFIASSDGELGCILGDDHMADYEVHMTSNADTLLLGRKTYEDFAGYWPTVPTNPGAQDWEQTQASNLNAMRKIVLSTSTEQAEWNNSTIIRGLDPEEIKQLKKESANGVSIYGSASVVRQLAGFGLIDEYHLLVHPVFLGRGKTLFGDIEQRVPLKLVSSGPFESGVVLLTYQPAST